MDLIPQTKYKVEFLNNAGRYVEERVLEYQEGIVWLTKYGGKRFIERVDIIRAEPVEDWDA